MSLEPTPFIDCDHPAVREFTGTHTQGVKTDLDKGVRLYYAVRDEIRYNPYDCDITRDGLKASATLERGNAFCVPKAILLAACARAAGIPSRVAFADVRNHLNSEKLNDAMSGNDLFVFHGITILHLNGQWVKCTPAFNASLCEKTNTLPLEFDGLTDSLFHAFDAEGRKHMEYVHQRGEFDDLPYEEMLAAFREHYPDWTDRNLQDTRQNNGGAETFEAEAYSGDSD